MKYERQLAGRFRPDEVASRLGISIAEVLRRCRDGRFPGASKTSFGWGIPEAEVLRQEAALEANDWMPRWKREEIYQELQEMYERHGLANGYIPEPRDEE